MSFNKWQIERLRAALRAYHRYTPGKASSQLSWSDVANRIDEYAHVDMPGETLRQFVEGVNKRANPGRQRILKTERLEAVAAFLSHPEINALSMEELDEERETYEAPLRLLTYLQQKLDEEILKPPPKLNGTYQSVTGQGDFVYDFQLSLTIQEEGIIQANSTRAVYRYKGSKEFKNWSDQEKHERRRSTEERRGWAVSTPEDNILFFMKEMPYDNNHYHHLAIEIDFWTDEPIMRLVLTQYDYPMDFDGHALNYEAKGRTDLSRHFDENLLFLEKI